ncbi:MAG: M20/M25/M40 family metallo-hydrolase [Oscillospiraceae bacterium]|jgi:carboxypeptidase PM20D1|nr:M20/M25/M40 family metallo-hydrolase [Oscillospiraceae bacterium]
MPQEIWLALALAAVVLALTAARMFVRTGQIGRARVGPVLGRAADPETAARAAETLGALIRCKTVSHDAPRERAEWVHLRDELKRRYPSVHAAMTRETVGLFSLLYHWKAPDPQGDPLLFCAHLDVVPAESGAWRHPPFEGLIEDGHVWGRGALDCKHLVTCLLEAAELLLRQGFSPTRDIYFAFGHDEETGGAEGAAALAALFAKQNLHFALVLDEGGALTRGALSLRRPVAEVGVSEKGMMNVRLTARSAGGHAAHPPRHTALGRIAEAVCRVEFRPGPARLTPLITDLLTQLAPNLSFSWRFLIANRRLLRRPLLRRLARSGETSWVRTTFAPTTARAGTAPNVLPDTAEAVLNVRLLHGERGEDILVYLRDLFSGLDLEMEVLFSQDPSSVSDYRGAPFAQLGESVRAVFGAVPVVPFLLASATDARRYEPFSSHVFRFCPFVLTPDESARMHAVDERVSLEALGLAVAFYEDLLRRCAGPEAEDSEDLKDPEDPEDREDLKDTEDPEDAKDNTAGPENTESAKDAKDSRDAKTPASAKDAAGGDVRGGPRDAETE